MTNENEKRSRNKIKTSWFIPVVLNLAIFLLFCFAPSFAADAVSPEYEDLYVELHQNITNFEMIKENILF